MTRLLLALTGLLLLLGCQPQEQPGSPAATSVLFTEPLPLHRFELPTEALAIWRHYAEQQPTLLLLSDLPMLQPLPEALRADAETFVRTAPQAQLRARSLPGGANPLLLPEMTVDTALRLGWLGKLAWVLPLADPRQPLTVESFRRQLLERGLASPAETAMLAGDDRRIAGRLRGVPFVAATLENHGELPGPLLVHIDLSYFERLYKNDIATPLFELVIRTLGDLRALQLPVLAVTLSYGHLEGRIALDVRMLGEFAALLTEDPAAFATPLPVNLARQGEIFYLANFFQKERIRELALAQERELPAAAWVKFNLFRSAVEHKEGGAALDYLAQAVALDRIYALEYRELARFAYDKGQPQEALRLLRLAEMALPEDATLTLQTAQLAMELGAWQPARQRLTQLRTLPWSTVYFAEMPGYLAGFEEALRKAAAP